MFRIFKKKPVIDISSRKWILDNYAWAMRNCGGGSTFEDIELVLPNNEYFPAKSDDRRELVRSVFENMKKYAGLQDWPIDIIEKEGNPNPIVAPTIVVSGAPYEATTKVIFPENDEDMIIISYSLELVNNFERLVSAFAYELSSIFCAYVEEDPPSDVEFLGHNIELTAVFLGFGIILANSAFQYQQYTDVDSQGWTLNAQGYLSQYELTYILAIFSEVKDIDNNLINNFLKKSLRSYFKLARKELKDDPKILWRLKNAIVPKL